MSYFQNFGYKIGLCNLMIENISGRTGNVGYKVGVCNLRLRHLTWFFGNLGYNLGLCNLQSGHFVSGTVPLSSETGWGTLLSGQVRWLLIWLL